MMRETGILHYLEWDSKFFGIPIARLSIDLDRFHPSLLDEALNQAKKEKISCLYFEIPFEIPELISYCCEKKFLLVDFKTTLGKELSREASSYEESCIETGRNENYYPYLEKIAEDIALKSRFYFDSHFGEIRASKLYREWLRVSFYENYCFDFMTYVKRGNPRGFLTLKMRNETPYIDLIGVSEQEQGQNIGSDLIRFSEKRVLEAGHTHLSVVSQGHNIRALRTYQKNGFQVYSSNVYFHIWLEQID